MSPIESRIEIARPPKEVFDYVTDPRRFPEWQVGVVSVRMLDDDRFETVRDIKGAERTMVQRIAENDPPHRWAARGVEGPIRAHAAITVEPVGDRDASSVAFALDFEGHGIGVALLPVVRRMTAKVSPVSYRNLKELLEAGADRS